MLEADTLTVLSKSSKDGMTWGRSLKFSDKGLLVVSFFFGKLQSLIPVLQIIIIFRHTHVAKLEILLLDVNINEFNLSLFYLN